MSPPHGGVDRNLVIIRQNKRVETSPPHGGVDRNHHWTWLTPRSPRSPPSRGRGSKHRPWRGDPALDLSPLTGAWIETAWESSRLSLLRVAPSRGRGSKLNQATSCRVMGVSPPHGGVDRNYPWSRPWGGSRGRPLTGAWIETGRRGRRRSGSGSRPLTGAWIETTRRHRAPSTG